MKFLYKLISTWWLSGTVKKMPGTVGSLAAYPIVPLVLSDKILGAAIILFLFLIGLWSTDNYIKHYQTSHDPKEVVIDEVVGQFLTIFLISVLLNQEVNCPLLLLCFLFFRFFDIIKTWPINLIDKNIKGPLGVMLDDIIAAILACVPIGAFYCLLSVYAG
ncbi:phosphatidylglycerophosphatase A family protein [Wolbachia endosymbiont of Wuchereria bancrofti]|uniref:phosphatidylglycerophosphatase A family protein n=1 Tax=Wolbachia endosymbiont of Wuchereria bancrofti TaxID=96496 RepID=UPI000B4D3D2E|nr:phosphatidylglycerophosphatase A [Wolbachia endosymbiont of Wuchereria bancrofti]OWZ25064.1 phosphatidylglycerophosphatase A family protein [Wolbachia endosymbiont of Wuchereria bancrofti]